MQDHYLLGRSSRALVRLERQAALIEAETEALFRRAGIGRGDSVLEIGSGAGDVAMLLGRLVGPGVSPLGVERAADSAALAAARIAAVGDLAVQIEVADLNTFVPTKRFDALVGRFILPYLEDPVGTLARLIGHVRPGGAIAFMEFDVRQIGSAPEVPLLSEIGRWIVGAYEYRGVEPGLGSSLGATFRAAGLPWPELAAFQKSSCGPGGIIWYFEQLVRTLAPEIVAAGLATEAEIAAALRDGRLEAEGIARGATFYGPRWVSGWTHVPSG